MDESTTIYIVARPDWEEFDIKAVYDNEEAAEAHAATDEPFLMVFDYPLLSTFPVGDAR